MKEIVDMAKKKKQSGGRFQDIGLRDVQEPIGTPQEELTENILIEMSTSEPVQMMRKNM